MRRTYLWLCTLTATTAIAVPDARAFSPHGPALHGFAHFVAGPEFHGPGGGGPPPGTGRPPAPPPSGDYSYSGNSFDLSVTRNGRPAAPPPPTAPPPGNPERRGFFGRLFHWW